MFKVGKASSAIHERLKSGFSFYIEMFSLSWRKYLPYGESGCFLFTISGIGDHSAAHPITHVLANNQDLTCPCSRRDCFEHFLSCSPGSPSPVVHAGNAAIAAGSLRHCDARSCHRAGHRAGGRLHIALANHGRYISSPPTFRFLPLTTAIHPPICHKPNQTRKMHFPGKREVEHILLCSFIVPSGCSWMLFRRRLWPASSSLPHTQKSLLFAVILVAAPPWQGW